MRTESKLLRRSTSVLSLVGYPLLMLVINGGIFAALTFAGQAGAEPSAGASKAPSPEDPPRHASYDENFEKPTSELDVEGLDRQIDRLRASKALDAQDEPPELAELLATVERKQQIRRRQAQMKQVLPVRHFGGY